MHTQALIHPHRQRARTRSTAFLLALTAFVAAKLISLGAVNVSRAHDIEGMQMLHVDCSGEQSLLC